MTLKLGGSSSGFTELKAPAAAGSNTLVLPADNGSANEYLQTNGSGTLSWNAITSAAITPTAMTNWTTCGTSSTLDLTGLSASAERFQLFTHELSFSSGVNPFLRLGTGGSVATSGYCANGWKAAVAGAGDDDSDKMEAYDMGDASYKSNWMWDLVHCGSNTWYMQGVALVDTGSGAATTGTFGMSGKITLGGTLDIIQIGGGTIDGGTYRLITWT